MGNSRKHVVICAKCNHRGTILKTEKDHGWGKYAEHYSLSGLDGEDHVFRGEIPDWEDVFRETGAKCPKCNTQLTPENILQK